MKIHDIVNESLYIPSSLLDKVNAGINEAIKRGVYTPWLVFEARTARGRGEYEGFTYVIQDNGSIDTTFPDGRTASFPNDVAARTASDRYNLTVRTRTGVAQGKDGRWYVNYADGGRDDLQSFGSRREAVAAQRAWTGNRTRTRGVRNWSEYRGAWREHQDERLKRNGARIVASFQGWMRTLRYFGWLNSFLATVVGSVQILDRLQEIMADLTVDLALGLITAEEYDEGRQAVFGWFLTQAVTIFGTAVASGAIARVILWITRLRNAAAAATLWSGPIGPILSFIGGAAATWAVTWFLQRDSTQRAVMGFFVHGLEEEMGEGLAAQMSRWVASAGLGATEVVADWIGGVATSASINAANLIQRNGPDLNRAEQMVNQTADQMRNPTRSLGLDPRADAQASGMANEPPSSNGGFRGQTNF